MDFNIIDITSSEELEALKSIQLVGTVSKTAVEVFDRHINTAYEEFWFNGDPIKKVELLGTKALGLFTKSSVAQECLRLMYESVGINYTKKGVPEKYDMKWNADNSGVLTERVIEEEEEVNQPEE